MIGRFRGNIRLGCFAAVTAVLMTSLVGTADADTPSPAPSPSVTPSSAAATPTLTTSPTPTATATAEATKTPSPTPSASSTTPAPKGRQRPQAEAAPGLTLTVRSTYGSGVAYWSDIGAYAIRGSASGLADGSLVEVYRRSGSGSWAKLASARTDGAAYAVDVPVLGSGTFTFRTTTGGAPGSSDAVSSNSVDVTVGDSRVVFNRPVDRIDALKDPTLSGSIVPARSGVTINIDLLRDGKFVKIDDTRTDASGRFAMSLGYGHGSLAGYRVRATYRVPNRVQWEAAKSHHFTRVAVLNAVVTPTTAAEVAKTYRAGCPVGRSQLSTITMNHYGADKKMHRGVLIVRSDLAGEIKYAFSRALSIRYPVTRMANPNVYDGNDPRQMRADNSSGFNCRSVVGNPYRRSPHSYGTAIDVNTRQNPYRDVSGKWWPENGTAYIDRTPRRGGMLILKSTLVKTLRNDGFFWGGLWSPGRDYQHFQY